MTVKKSIENIINAIGKERVNHWILLFSISLFSVGIFEFLYLWLIKNCITSDSNFLPTTFTHFLVWFIQVYSVLFIPLLTYLGYKYRYKFNSNNIKILGVFIIVLIFGFSTYVYRNSFTGLFQWIFLFMFVFIVISLKFNSLFAFSFSYLCFFCGNMLFEMAELNFLDYFGTLLSYILIYGIFILVLYKLKIKSYIPIIISFIPIVFQWIYYYPAWSVKDNITEFYKLDIPNEPYTRLYTFPFFMTVSLIIYLKYRKCSKP